MKIHIVLAFIICFVGTAFVQAQISFQQIPASSPQEELQKLLPWYTLTSGNETKQIYRSGGVAIVYNVYGEPPSSSRFSVVKPERYFDRKVIFSIKEELYFIDFQDRLPGVLDSEIGGRESRLLTVRDAKKNLVHIKVTGLATAHMGEHVDIELESHTINTEFPKEETPITKVTNPNYIALFNGLFERNWEKEVFIRKTLIDSHVFANKPDSE